MPFTLLEYVVRVANNIRSKFSEFSIDCNTKMAQECTPEVTSRQMKFLTALREKGHCANVTARYVLRFQDMPGADPGFRNGGGQSWRAERARKFC